MAKLSKSRSTAYFLLIINTIVWGLAFPFVKKGFDAGLTPETFLLGRFFFASLLSLPILFFSKPTAQTKRTFKAESLVKIVILELIGTVAALLLLYKGLELTSAIEATLIGITWPIFMTIAGVIFLKEKEDKNEWIGLILAVTGTLLLVVRPLVSGYTNGTLTGNVLIFSQNLVIVAYYLLAKKAYKNLNKWLVTTISFWIGTLSFAAISLYQGGSPITQITTLFTPGGYWPLIAVLYMATFGSIIGLTTYLLGQDKIETSEASIFTYLQPLVSIPAAIILLGESLKPLEILAMAIIFSGVYLASKRN